LEKYEEALKIRRELAKENPNRYEINYAKLLIMGVFLFEKHKSNLDNAKKMLKNYSEVPYAIQLMSMIKEYNNQ